ncbi:YbaB/EbfC family nucleoid-associated protein [Streptomyces sp. BE133]|uniref:YbaB/EbfC family nucleoid-associated protein n=1 Tax=Streptomyces sp. BE133 TaxID=3002523 RepID=UPI002E768E2B|nr:YbaB/EbfC family nucleoid-associated protein [Streptomyces sp. BE133]MEE1811710.1 YbaB/EbfC family nucleoid-associated protein [Streptomyces sp. BE133]
MVSFQEQLAEAMAGLAEQTKKIQQVQEELARASASATSKDRMVTASVNAHGEILSFKFHTEGYRTMPGAQLAEVLKNTVNAARTEMNSKVSGSVRPLMGSQEELASGFFGGGELDDLLAPLRAMQPDGLTETVLGGGRKPSANRGEEDEFYG